MKEEKEMNPVEQAIKRYLDKRASEDPLFAKAYAKPSKNIGACFQYVVSMARERGRAVYMTDEEVFGLAVHYYDEDNIKVKKVHEQVETSSSAVRLTDEEKEEAREEAIEEYKREYTRRIKAAEERKSQKKKEKLEALKKAAENAPSLFDNAMF